MILGILQLNIKKLYVYGAIALIWIVIPTIVITLPSLSTVIVQGTCVRFSRYQSYAAERAVGFFTVLIGYFLPLTVMAFCYARIVRALRAKVKHALAIFVQSGVGKHYIGPVPADSVPVGQFSTNARLFSFFSSKLRLNFNILKTPSR